jgi:hypothetical protein
LGEMKWRSVPSGFIVAGAMTNSPPLTCPNRNRIFFPLGDQTGSPDTPWQRLEVRLVRCWPSESTV